jgi:hypothetical protein
MGPYTIYHDWSRSAYAARRKKKLSRSAYAAHRKKHNYNELMLSWPSLLLAHYSDITVAIGRSHPSLLWIIVATAVMTLSTRRYCRP